MKVPTLREQQKLLTRERLLASAREVFERKGYSAATIDEIAAGAGASRATFHRYFRGKAEVVLELESDLRASLTQLFEGLDDILADRQAPELHSWLGRAVVWFGRNRLLYEALEGAIAAEPGTASRDGFTELITQSLPRYLSEFPSDQRRRVEIRIELLLVMMARETFAGSVLLGLNSPDERDVLETLASLWMNEDASGSPAGGTR